MGALKDEAMSHGLSQAQWASRFLEQLAELQPTLSAEEQLACAKEAYAKAGDLLPELAAQIFALDLPPGSEPA